MLKRIKRYHTTLLIIVLCFAANATTPPLPEFCDGSMTPVDLPEKLQIEIPDSLRVTHITHVARHGARFLSSAKKCETLREKLTEARSKDMLSTVGKEFLAVLIRTDSATAGRWGELTPLGLYEENSIAKAQTVTFPSLFAEGRVIGRATYVPRVVMSMYEYSHGLASFSSKLDIYTSEGRVNSPLLRFFETDSAYAAYLDSGAWKLPADDYCDKIIPTRPGKALLADSYKITDKEARKLSADMYAVLQGGTAASLGFDKSAFFTSDEYNDCWKATNLKHYLERTGNRFNPYANAAAAPLLREIIGSVDSVVNGQSNSVASLYFGHAETLMPLFSLMNLPGCNAPDAAVDRVWKEWRDYEVVPLGAYMTVVLLTSPSDESYAAVVLNGNSITPIKDDSRLIVTWAELKAYWENRLTTATSELAP